MVGGLAIAGVLLNVVGGTASVGVRPGMFWDGFIQRDSLEMENKGREETGEKGNADGLGHCWLVVWMVLRRWRRGRYVMKVGRRMFGRGFWIERGGGEKVFFIFRGRDNFFFLFFISATSRQPR